MWPLASTMILRLEAEYALHIGVIVSLPRFEQRGLAQSSEAGQGCPGTSHSPGPFPGPFPPLPWAGAGGEGPSWVGVVVGVAALATTTVMLVPNFIRRPEPPRSRFLALGVPRLSVRLG